MTLTPNLLAFLGMIRFSEGTASEPDPYRVVFGKQHVIQDLSNHPSITGEWMGVNYTNQATGKTVLTTAAGAYQINRPTWIDIIDAMPLPDFGPDSQDRAAAWLIGKAGAYALIENGDIVPAISLCRGRWASLPGGTSGQPEQRLTDLITVYKGALA